jgi:hypothetical protein
MAEAQPEDDSSTSRLRAIDRSQGRRGGGGSEFRLPFVFVEG